MPKPPRRRRALSLALTAAALAGAAACSSRHEPPAPAANAAPTTNAPAADAAPPATPAAGEQPRGGPAANPLDAARAKDQDKTVPTMTPAELGQRLEGKEKTYVIEVRSSDAPPAIEGAEVVRPDVVDAWAAKLPKQAHIVAYCTWPAKEASTRAVRLLRELGYENAYELGGTIDEWNAAKLRVPKR